MNIVVFGSQGSGKSTHAKYIAEKLDVPYIYTGDLFRELEKENFPRGKKVKNLMRKGVLIPNEISIPAFEEYTRNYDISKGFVLDGYPRTLEQAKALKFKINLIFYVRLPENIAIERLIERKRYDDTYEVIKKRLDMFDKFTRPLFGYFKNQRVKIVEVDNSPSIEKVQRKIDGLLEKQARN